MTLSPSASIAEAIDQLDKAGTGALVLCTADQMLFGLLTDGDIRRAILRGLSLETPCESIASLDPLTVNQLDVQTESAGTYGENDINHLPVVDATGPVIRFLLRRNLAQHAHTELSAVIMAGGYGKRLLPLTEQVPKPMLPVGDGPFSN